MTEVTRTLRRVNPVPGMMIDVETWRTAHDYHREHARLHHRALHGWGIATGLDVLVGKSVNALLVQPGVAVDPAGNFVVVDQEQVHRLASNGRGMVYLVLRYRDAPLEPGGNDGTIQTRILESFSIEERTLPPTDTDLELARVDFDPQRGAIQAAADPRQPHTNELDTRGRVHLGAAGGALAGPDATDGVVSPAPQVLADMRQRLDGLDQQLHHLAEQMQAIPPRDPAAAPRLDRMHERVEDIARQVALLWQRPQAARTTPSEGPSETVASDGAVELPLLELRQQLDGLAQRLNQLDGRFHVLVQERQVVDGQQQALADQVAALTRQQETTAPELAQVRDTLDEVAPRLEQLAASVEPLERQIQQLADQTEAVSDGAWPTPATPRTSGRELRLVLGRTSTPGWEHHREGLRLLGRELVATVEPAARVLGEVALTELSQVEFLYLTGYSALGLEDAEIQGILRVLDAGGLVLAEGCAAGPTGEVGAREFAFSFIELAQRLGRRLTRLERGHKLFEARYKFADPPPGARPARVLEADGVIYSDADYGCAWQGGAPQQPLARSVIRDGFEFGVNMAIYRQARG